MSFGKKRILVSFLEKDNLKLLAYEAAGKTITRIFGGQINFSQEVLRDSFIAEPVKFTAQVKAAFNAKGELSDLVETVLFIPGDKTFIKSIPASDSVESFIRSLPYFKEELIIDPGVEGQREPLRRGSGQEGKGQSELTTHVAFEKKLIEDLERPFLDAGKKVTAVVSSINVLVNNYAQNGQMILLVPFEKDTTIVSVRDGIILDVAVVPKEVTVGRVGEFIVSHELNSVRTVATVGVFPRETIEKLRVEKGMEVTELAPGDIYDLVVESYLQGAAKKGLGASLPNFSLPKLPSQLPNQKFLFLGGAVLAGFLLAIMIIRNVGKVNLPSISGKSAVKAPVTAKPVIETPAPAPAPKPADYKVRVLNGTLVAGEAGRAAEQIKTLGFDVVETKNATAAGFVATRLRVTADVPSQIIDQLKNSLLQTYESVSQEPLVDDSVKIEIIIGKKK